MEIITGKEKEPELKFKKETEIAVHQGNPAVTKKESPMICRKKSGSIISGKRYEETSEKDKSLDTDQEKNLYGKDRKRLQDSLASAAIGEKFTHKRDGRIKEKGTTEKKAENSRNDQRDRHIGFKTQAENRKGRNILTNEQAKENYRRTLKIKELSGNLNIRSVRTDPALRVNSPGSQAAAIRTEGGEAGKRNAPDMERNIRPAGIAMGISGQAQSGEALKSVGRNGKPAEQLLRKEIKISGECRQRKKENQAIYRRGEKNPTIVQRKGGNPTIVRRKEGNPAILQRKERNQAICRRKETHWALSKRKGQNQVIHRRKGQNQVHNRGEGQNPAIRRRKLQFMFHKLSGSEEQDSLGQMAKDLFRMKATAVMAKTAYYLGALLAPLSGMVFLAAFPVVLIVVLLYCSPIAAFMENPSGDTPSIQEVLGEYYMEFNQAVSANAGENGTVAYLHEKDGNYISNYMDTLMVYMVQYGTGDLGIVMDEKHKHLLKKVFDEMNGLEDKTVTTTIRAGQSLGNVVTSAYCACSICCGQWAGGPTASGAMPKADHTIAVDAADPFVPMGTRVIMGGREYVVEDTGAFARYGVQFDIYFDSHTAASNWGHVTMEAFLADGNENTVSVTKKGSYVKNLNFEDYIALGKLTGEQEELLREVMGADFRSEIPSSGAGSDVANLALTKVGCQYSQERRYEEGYYDCSSLVQRCYAQFGISLPAIASTQGQYMVEQGLEVTEDMLEPGDVIFYSYENNGQFRNISHVAIYIGNGRMVHASSPERGVVNDPFSPSNVGLYGRPGRGK